MRLVIGLSKMFRQPIEATLPVGAPFGNPVFGRLQGRRLDATGPHPPCLFGPDEAACFQHLEVLDNRRQRDGEWLGKLGDRCWSEAETLHHHPPGRDSQGLEQEIERSIMVKHWVNYITQAGQAQCPANSGRLASPG
jgi:hypothetical protein